MTTTSARVFTRATLQNYATRTRKPRMRLNSRRFRVTTPSSGVRVTACPLLAEGGRTDELAQRGRSRAAPPSRSSSHALEAPGPVDRLARLGLEPVPRISPQVREWHPQRQVLHLPDVAELVRDQVVVRGILRLRTQEDRVPGRVPVEAPKPRQPVERRHDEDPHAPGPHAPGAEVEPVEPLLGAREPI